MSLFKKEVKNLIDNSNNGLSLCIESILKLEILNKYLLGILKLNGIDYNTTSAFDKTKIIENIVKENEYSEESVLSACGLESSTYHYNLRRKTYSERNAKYENIIRDIYNEHDHNIGVGGVQADLNNKYKINLSEKKIRKIRDLANLHFKRKACKKYCSFKGDPDPVRDDLIKRNFLSEKPLEKIATDIMELKYPFGKAYYQCFYDLFNRQILVYDIAKNVSANNTIEMLKKLHKIYGNKLKGTIIHSDHGSQYICKDYVNLVKEYGMTQSFSRIGNCIDNSIYESFNAHFKKQIYEGKEKMCETFEQLFYYIKCEVYRYNHIFVRACLGNKTPIEYKEDYYKRLKNE